MRNLNLRETNVVAQQSIPSINGKSRGFFFLRFYLFIQKDMERERGTDTGRGRSRPPAGSPTWDLVLGLLDHALGRRQALNR